MAESFQARTAALLLAAGSSTRLGQSKQLLTIGQETLVQRTVRLAQKAGCDPVFVVISTEAKEVRRVLSDSKATLVENPHAENGMGTSLSMGIHALRTQEPDVYRLLLLVCDQPLVTAHHLRKLLSADSPSGMTAAFYKDRLGVPAVFSSAHFDALSQLTGDQGARSLLREHRVSVTAVAIPEAAFDLDTMDDLKHLPNED